MGSPWPRSEDELADFLDDLGSRKSVGKSSYERYRTATWYLEAAAGRCSEESVADRAGVKDYIEELALQAEGKKLKDKKEAPQLLLKILAAMEKLVLGDGPRYLRAYTWLKLVCFWGVLRGEDTT